MSDVTTTPLGDVIKMGVDGDMDARSEFERRWERPFQSILDFAEEVKGSYGGIKERTREAAGGERQEENVQS